MTSRWRYKRFFSWLWVAFCALAILFVVPFARTIQRFVSTHIGLSFFVYSVLLVVIVGFLNLFYFLYFRLKIREVSNYFWITIVTSAYIYFTIKLWHNPVEAVHFLEYGLLGFFLFRALKYHIHDKIIYLIAFLIGSLIGIFDEIFQWVVPNRFWDLRDVGLNALSSGLFQVLLWKGINPKTISLKVQKKSIHMASILLAANIILLGLCLSNTPHRVRSYTQYLPFLTRLQNEEAMSEFRFKHKDGDVGIFYSRLTLSDLKKIDSERAEEYGKTLRVWENKDYTKYLHVYPGSIYPFLYEIRIHIFRRDKRFERALLSNKKEIREENIFIAYKENLILEKYFGRTINNSPYKWSRKKKAQAEAMIDKNAPYRSPVSAGFFASVNERKMWAFIFVFLAVLTLFNFVLFSKRRIKRS